MPQARVHGDEWIIWPVASKSQQAVDLPADFYLQELMELSASDLEATAAIMRQCGLLFDISLDELALNNFDWDDRSALEMIPDFDEAIDGVHYAGVRRDVVELHIEFAQQAIATWLAIQRPGGLEELIEPEITEDSLARFNAIPGNSPVSSLEEYRRLCLGARLLDLRIVVDGALSKFSVGLDGLSSRWPTVYSVSFLQLYNHLVEKAELRQCANEPCRRTFVRQRGRAEFGQHRTSGILYCSRDCARAQAQRQLRRRRRAEQAQLPA
jgi:hypothetical protein